MTTTESFAWESDGVRWRVRYDEVGNGPDALLLPALSSVSAREEMTPLARLLQERRGLVLRASAA